MSNIITFYSYKGGVGRSMALANIAFELARRNKKVLMVDWDLEAPGLERYFNKFEINNSSKGLLQLLLTYNNNENPDYRNYISAIHASQLSQPLYLMQSGREQDPAKYSSELEHFNWDHFFQNSNGGMRLEELRNHWRHDFDLVLIDSRTGLSDASGICTILLPDIVIPMFTANYQSLFGIRDIVKFIQNARQKLEVDRMSLTILPIPSRFGTRVEFRESQEWLDRISDILKDCFSDWLPRWIEPRYILEKIKIPQIDFFGFGEKLAVVEQGTNDPEGMGFVYAKLADFLASEFIDIESFVGKEYYNERKDAFQKQRELQKRPNENKEKYKYDLFIIYPRPLYQWIREVVLPAVAEYLSEELGNSAKIYFEVSELTDGSYWSENTKDALEHSKTFLNIIGIDELGREDFVSNDLLIAERLQNTANTNIIFHILHNKGLREYESILKKTSTIDLSPFTLEALKSSRKLNTQFDSRISQLCKAIASSIKVLEDINMDVLNIGNYTKLQIEALAKEYEQLRKKMPSGNTRTRMMQDIVEKMRLNALNAKVYLPEFTQSDSPGNRLAAITILQENPDINYLDWLVEHVGEVEKPFIGYQAAVGIYNISKALSSKYTFEILNSVNKALDSIEKYNYKDPNQVKVLESAKAELSYSTLSQVTSKPKIKKVFGDTSFKTYKWYMTGADRCMPVARIGKDSSKGFGSGFVLRGNKLHESLGDELFLLTNSHVVSDNLSENGLHAKDVVVIFEALNRDEEFTSFEILWNSPIHDLNVTVLRFNQKDHHRLERLMKNVQLYPISTSIPVIEEPLTQKVYVIGYPYGGTLQISFEDSFLLDYQFPLLHYHTATEGGSSGGPVFNQKWDLIGIHVGKSSNKDRFKSEFGLYFAKEGIWIVAIIEAIRRSFNIDADFIN